MAVVATSITKVKNRLIVTGVAAEPNDTVIDEMIRDAYREVLGRIDLPRLVTETVTASGDRYIATVTGEKCYTLGQNQRALVPSVEYYWADGTAHFAPGVVVTDDSVWAWVKPDLDLTANDIVTTCVHGVEWAEPAVIWRAAMLMLSRMSRAAGSTGAAMHGPHYRSLEGGYEEIIKTLQRKHDTWMQDQMAAIQARIQLGDHPLIESPYATIRERTGGRRWNRAVGNG